MSAIDRVYIYDNTRQTSTLTFSGKDVTPINVAVKGLGSRIEDLDPGYTQVTDGTFQSSIDISGSPMIFIRGTTGLFVAYGSLPGIAPSNTSGISLMSAAVRIGSLGRC